MPHSQNDDLDETFFPAALIAVILAGAIAATTVALRSFCAQFVERYGISPLELLLPHLEDLGGGRALVSQPCCRTCQRA